MSILPPSLPSVTVDGRSLHGDDLLAAAGVVAERVAGARVVAIEATPSLETVVAVVGCLLAGTPLVPVPPDSGQRERAHLLADSRAEFTLDVDLSARSSQTWTEPDDGTAMIMYTSGTTGLPKGAVISRRAVIACLDGLADAWAWTPDDTLVHGLPLFHVHGLVLGVLGALRVGSPLVHTGKPTPPAYAAARGTLYFGVPTIWGRIAADPPAAQGLRGARLLVSGSAGLPAPVFRTLQQHAGQGPIERYGMTETLITIATRADGSREPGRVGTPLRGVETRIVADADADADADTAVGPGEIGNLQVRGTTLCDGYLGAQLATTGDGWFRTGDAASVDAAGNHRIVGRAKDDLIKSGGYRIGAGEIEAVLLEHPDVTEAAVIGVPDDDLGQRIVAYVVSSSNDAQMLIDHVGTQLSAHKRPREVRFVDALPRNAMGKIQKARLG